MRKHSFRTLPRWRMQAGGCCDRFNCSGGQVGWHTWGGNLRGCLARFGIAFEAQQVSSDVTGVLVPEIAVLLQGFVDDFLKLRWQIRIQPHRWRRRAIQNGFENHRAGFATKREYTSCHFVEQDTEGE